MASVTITLCREDLHRVLVEYARKMIGFPDTPGETTPFEVSFDLRRTGAQRDEAFVVNGASVKFEQVIGVK